MTKKHKYLTKKISRAKKKSMARLKNPERKISFKSGKFKESPGDEIIISGDKPTITLAQDVMDIIPSDLENTERKDETIPELIDTIEFINGKNKLSIQFCKVVHRKYTVKIFLNDFEVRPQTYSGTSPAFGFWNVLKAYFEK